MFTDSLFSYKRFSTRNVKVGTVEIGGDNPIRVQSMTTTDTMDTAATVDQSISLADVGCEIIRITAPSKKEAENLKAIKEELKARGVNIPLVADIHFTPNAAEIAAKIVDKVRVNPGNYADKKKFNTIEYTDEEYQEQLERINVKFTPLVNICKEEGIAMRIGTNHGSLSDRIMSRYGDTPNGMVESALEFIRICESLDYHDLIISMKASNPQVMVHAYRLLMRTFKETDRNYPIHLGVTEAGDGEDGRIKSAVGIGTLLEDGIGDTIRVSLTEDPEAEIPVANDLAKRYENRSSSVVDHDGSVLPIDFYNYKKRSSLKLHNIGGDNAPVIVADFSNYDKITREDLQSIGYTYDEKIDKWHLGDQAADLLYTAGKALEFDIPGSLNAIQEIASVSKYLSQDLNLDQPHLIEAELKDLTDQYLDLLSEDQNAVLILNTNHEHGMAEQRVAISKLITRKIETPIILSRTYDVEFDKVQLFASADLGALLLDGLGDGLFIRANQCSVKDLNALAFGILQATRTRISKTDYIACPSCGRTLFDLQEVTAKIRSRTDHLKGVKIGIMGCIVNGPGEMADADYGYVGSGVRKITLYKGQEVMKKGVDESIAVDNLINIIKEDGKWVEPRI
jgi:(E)-4-hydroxy-3-methylbut-2-enyl-diphosphate synthase